MQLPGLDDEMKASGNRSFSSSESVTRRRFLGSGGVAVLAAIAGCTGDDTPSADDQSDSTTDDADDTESGSSGQSNGDDSDDGGDVTDGGDDSTTETESEEDDDDSTGDTIPSPHDSFRMEGTMSHPEDGVMDVNGITYGEDFYIHYLHPNGSEFEIYQIGDKKYSVSEHGCFVTTPDSFDFDFLDEIQMEFESLPEEITDPSFWDGRSPSSSTELDGHDVDIYEFQLDQPVGYIAYTLYVDSETGYIRRNEHFVSAENVTVVVDHSDWGEVGPVTPPEQDCVEM